MQRVGHIRIMENYVLSVRKVEAAKPSNSPKLCLFIVDLKFNQSNNLII